MGNPTANRLMPTRQLVVRIGPDAALAVAAQALAGENFVPRTEPGHLPAVFEFGNLVSEFFFSNFSIFGGDVGRVGKHGLLVVDSVDSGDGTTLLTMSLVTGSIAAPDALRAVQAAAQALTAAGQLVELRPEMTSWDLPKASANHPKGFKIYWKKNALLPWRR